MAFSELVIGSSTPEKDFLEELKKGNRPEPLPAGLDVPTLRQHAFVAAENARKAGALSVPGVSESEIQVPLAGGEVLDAHVYAPSDESLQSLPVYLFFHGGGFCIGSRFDDMDANRRIVFEAQVIIVSLEYRLAPEHPFPTAVHDGLHALQWIAANEAAVHPKASVGKGLIIGGTSAGGNLANAVAYLNRDQKSPVRVTGQFLSVPPLLPLPAVPEAYRSSFKSHQENVSFAIPSPELAQTFIAAYKPTLTSPLFVPPAHPDGHARIPPTYIQVCGLDSLRDEGVTYAQILQDNGIKVHLDVYPGLPHHFWEFFPSLKEQAERRAQDSARGLLWLLQQTGT